MVTAILGMVYISLYLLLWYLGFGSKYGRLIMILLCGLATVCATLSFLEKDVVLTICWALNLSISIANTILISRLRGNDKI